MSSEISDRIKDLERQLKALKKAEEVTKDPAYKELQTLQEEEQEVDKQVEELAEKRQQLRVKIGDVRQKLVEKYSELTVDAILPVRRIGGELKSRVYHAVKNSLEGLTKEQVAEKVGSHQTGITRALGELEKNGRVVRDEKGLYKAR